MPAALVSACGYALPFAELTTGALLLAGALTRAAAIAGGLVMIALVLGATSIEHFNVIGDQLVHALFLTGGPLAACIHGVAISLNVPAQCLPDTPQRLQINVTPNKLRPPRSCVPSGAPG